MRGKNHLKNLLFSNFFVVAVSKKVAIAYFENIGYKLLRRITLLKKNIFLEKQKDPTNLQVQRCIYKISTITDKI